MKKNHIAILFVVFSILITHVSAQPVIQEGLLIDGVDGVLKKGPNVDVWSFIPDESIAITPNISFPGGKPLEMLPSSVLEQMTELAGRDNQIHVQLWALFTEYKHTNYLYSVYFLPLREDKPAATGSQEAKDGTEKEQTAQQEESIIPSDILKQIKSNKTPDLKKFQQVSAVTGDINLIGRAGYLTKKNNVFKFEPDTLGMKLDNKEFLLMPNSMLAEAENQMAWVPGKQRYNVSGLVTQYKGKTYMLLRRATRTYSHGNFRD